jgi:hypothetical protein
MHAHMRGTELEQQEEELQEHEEGLKKRKKNYWHMSERWRNK